MLLHNDWRPSGMTLHATYSAPPSHIALGSLATVHPHLYPAWEQAQLKLIALAHCTSKTTCEHSTGALH